MGHGKAAVAFLGGAGKGTRFVAEKFALDQCRRNRRAIHLDERPVVAPASAMNRSRDHFFSRAGFAENQDRRIGGRDLLHLAQDFEPRGALADDAVGTHQQLNFFAQIFGLDGERMNLVLRFDALIHIAQDESVVRFPFDIETRQGRLGLKTSAIVSDGVKTAGNPQRALTHLRGYRAR